MSTNDNKRILCVGLACLDVVHVVKAFPLEDTDQRSLDQYSARGGNASNSSSVLSHLGEHPSYFGTLADGALETAVMERDFKACNIDISRCIRHPDTVCPNSAVIVNKATASRTIIHTNKDLPELTLNDFKSKFSKADLEANFKWVHFEGRNLENVKAMLKYVTETCPDLPVSVEVEKVGRGFEEFIPLADVVLLSKDVAMANGAKDMKAALTMFKGRLRKNAKLVCAWGAQGACAYDSKAGSVTVSPAFPPIGGVVDTLGAGDTFNACVIGGLSLGQGVEKVVEVGCRVAGAKVGQRGFKGLKEVYQQRMK